MSLGACGVAEALCVVRALGAHRYVAGRLHLVHAFALASLAATTEETEAARAWATATLRDATVDPSSRDERLWRPCSEAEVVAVLDGFWSPGAARAHARGTLEDLLAAHDLPVPESSPFDESAEDEMHPLLVDAGWELIALAQLDADRHRGALSAFGNALAFESARFEEETAIPPTTHLYELPAIGPVELLRGADEAGVLVEPLVVWAAGDETYLDYVIRGVRRAAKLPERDEGTDEEPGDP
jgi:hypothetical protein